MRIVVALFCAGLAGCATSKSRTVEDVKEERAALTELCEARGYPKGSPDFQTCYQLEEQKVAQDRQVKEAVGGAALGSAVHVLGATAASVFLSDARAKTDIIEVGKLGRHNLYRFRYIDGSAFHVGVLAQEVQVITPEAVIELGGFLWVDYSKL